MQKKLKPIFLLVTLAATACIMYAANDARAQGAPNGMFSLPVFSPGIISISPRLEKGHLQIDTVAIKRQQEAELNEIILAE